MKVVLAGATGFIGRLLISRLIENQYEVALLTRSPEKVSKDWGASVRPVLWNGRSAGDWQQCFEGKDAVINLCGEPIAGKKWTPEQKNRIVSSRIESTRAIVLAIHNARVKPAVLVNASAVGYYGWDTGDREVAEADPAGSGFLAETCAAWEKEALKAAQSGARVCLARIGIVLEKDGGALQKMLPPFRFFIGGPLGSGRQWFPWVHREDVVGMLLMALKDNRVSGPFNVCAPEAVTLGRFAAVLGKILKRPSFFPVPGFVLKLILGEMAVMLLEGQRAVPRRMQSWGYSFRYPELESALGNILKPAA